MNSPPKTLPTDFDSREAIAEQVEGLCPWLEPQPLTPYPGGKQAAHERLGQMDPLHYGKTRNHLTGKVTRLSPYIRHGIVSLNRVRNEALAMVSQPQQIEKFIQELGWRDFWQRIYWQHPEWIWQDVEAYKTGYDASDYAHELPADIAAGRTGVACIDQFIHELLETGYMHNHTRMYVAAYTVHWRRVRWQVGAEWFLHHLIDGDPASNNLSWQWVASTFGGKPYMFNLENVQKYAHAGINTKSEDNAPLVGSYDELKAMLFPRLQEGR